MQILEGVSSQVLLLLLFHGILFLLLLSFYRHKHTPMEFLWADKCQCPICLQQFSGYIRSSCLHDFCLPCLRMIWVSEGSLKLKCAVCRSQIKRLCASPNFQGDFAMVSQINYYISELKLLDRIFSKRFFTYLKRQIFSIRLNVRRAYLYWKVCLLLLYLLTPLDLLPELYLGLLGYLDDIIILLLFLYMVMV